MSRRRARAPRLSSWLSEKLRVQPQTAQRAQRRRARRKGGIILRYCTESGGRVKVPRILHPFATLGSAPGATFKEVRSCYMARSSPTLCTRQERALASLAYHMLVTQNADHIDSYRWLGEDEVEIANVDIGVLAAVGDQRQLLRALEKADPNSAELQRGEHLYLASRSGFYDVVRALLATGCVDVNDMTVHQSSPLHVATFYSRHAVVRLLLEHGASTRLVNMYGNVAADEASSKGIKNLLEEYMDDKIVELANSLVGDGLCSDLQTISHDGAVVAKVLPRSVSNMSARRRRRFRQRVCNWEVAWHGTKYQHVQSIMVHGLKASGAAGVKPQPGHIPLGKAAFGVKNWAHAVFVSPSLLYASHVVYAERVFGMYIDDDTARVANWATVMLVRVKPDSYTTHDPTTGEYKLLKGEPESSEYRIEVNNSDKMVINRVQREAHVEVVGVAFVRVGWLESLEHLGLSYSDVQQLFLDNIHFQW